MTTHDIAPPVRVSSQCVGLASSGMVQDLVRDISSGTFKRHERLPSEQEFSRKYGISVTAVRRGMEVLVREGFVSRRRGSGTYVDGAGPVAPAVRADTVLICRNVLHPPSHPYYGHIYPRLYARLAELGLAVADLVGPNTGYNSTQTEFSNIEASQIAPYLAAHSEIAGAILHRMSDEATAVLLARGLPCVAIGAHPTVPCVDYDWSAEFARAMGMALKAGARRIWALGAESADKDADLIRIAKAMANGAANASVVVHRNRISPIYSQTTYDACEATRTMLRSNDDRPDGIVIASDFHAQGVLDALAEAGTTPARCPVIVSLVNKESRIHTNLPFTALVSDGAALGMAAAELLHRWITDPRRAPGSVTLSCAVESARTP